MLSPMNKESVTNHIGNLAADYVLDLLPLEDKRYVSRHISLCLKCRQLVAAEERIGLLVRSAVDASGKNQAQLRPLMPRVPARRAGLFGSVTVHQQLALAGLFIVVFLAGFNLMFKQDMGGYTAPVSTAYVATASHTHTPTAATSSPTPIIRTDTGPVLALSVQSENIPIITPAPSPIEAR